MRILLAEDDQGLRAVVERGLKENGYVVDAVADGDAAAAFLHAYDYSAIILDWRMPKKSGLDVLSEARSRRMNSPVLMLTARDTTADRVSGLDAGADDYLVKPFDFPELLARIRALLRRPPAAQEPRIACGDLVFDPAARSASVGSTALPLTTTELSILEVLLRRAPGVVTRRSIALQVWDEEADAVGSNTIDVHLARLRAKLSGTRARIETVRGVGYRIAALMTWLRLRPRLGHAARVAAATTALIAVVYVVVVLVLDVLVGHRLTRDVDQHLQERLADARQQSLPLSGAADREDRDPNATPVFLWTSTPGGATVPSTPNAPTLPADAWSMSQPTTASLGSGTFRLAATPVRGHWVIAGQSLSQAAHVRGVLIASEIVVGPVLLAVLYFGSLAIGLKASAPVEEARRRQLELTADASHELRTPLSVIEAEVGLALNNERDAGYYRASLERVSGESKRLRRIVDDLLWLARFDSEPPPPGEEPVDVEVIARECARRFEPVATARELRLSVETAGSTPVCVKAPPEWIDRLLGALIDNACRYSRTGGAVRVMVGRSGGRAFVVVEDSGPGIPAEQRSLLFDRFHRATDQPGGAGLGLAIADSVVRSTGGRWNIGDVPGGGASMEVSWPAASDRDAGSTPDANYDAVHPARPETVDEGTGADAEMEPVPPPDRYT